MKDLIGKKFGRLAAKFKIVGSKAKISCLCDCGQDVVVLKSRLLNGNTKSCGCLQREHQRTGSITHGMSDSAEHKIWLGIIKRCTNKNTHNYDKYKDVGIHEDFLKDFKKFYVEIGPRPTTPGRWSVGRINNFMPYTYGNIRWEDDTQQSRNRSRQVNNKSGVHGVCLLKTPTGGAWAAYWNGLDKKQYTKSFGIRKYGDAVAKSMAVSLRERMINELNEQGAGYSSTHGMERY